MSVLVDLLDSVNQKFDPTSSSGVIDTNAQDAIEALANESKETLLTACPETRSEQLGVTGAQTVDMAAGQFHYVTASASTLTISFANTAAIAAGADSLLLFLWPKTFTIEWAASTVWTNDSAPDLSADTGHIITAARRSASPDEWAATYIGTTAIMAPV